jgi:hypothetical protein
MNVGIIVSNHLEVATEEGVICCVKSNDCWISKRCVRGRRTDEEYWLAYNRISASVRCSPKMNGPLLSAIIFSIRSRLSKRIFTFSS